MGIGIAQYPMAEWFCAPPNWQIRSPVLFSLVSAVAIMTKGQELCATKPRDVLIVEDNPDGRESLRMLLELLGVEVHKTDTKESRKR
jgi:hypothetical protein